MRMYDIIAKKRDRKELTNEEICFFINGYTKGEIPEYQAAAFCMAIYINGMTSKEVALLTAAMAQSGDTIDLSPIKGIKVDKHSTGGVGDKTTLVIAPIVATCGIKVAKMSGRGLGHTGGTLDKIESIPGARVDLANEDFFKQVEDIGVAVIGQTGDLAPADKKLYALRDVTATVSCLPLIASSIMSKKLASGADCILLDVKTGSGSFMKTAEEAIELAKAMVEIGEQNGKRTAALITDMDTPLGYNIGNSMEVEEAAQTLKGEGPQDLIEVCTALAANMLYLADYDTFNNCEQKVKELLANGKAFERLCDMVKAQGGDTDVFFEKGFKKAKYSFDILSPKSGYIKATDTEGIGVASVLLGAGRITKEDEIDMSAGIRINKKAGDFVNKNEVIATFYANDKEKFEQAKQRYLNALEFNDEMPEDIKLIYARVDKNGVTYY